MKRPQPAPPSLPDILGHDLAVIFCGINHHGCGLTVAVTRPTFSATDVLRSERAALEKKIEPHAPQIVGPLDFVDA